MGGFCDMKHEWNGKRFGKGAALVGAVALCLTLTGCYIPPDEIASGTEHMTVGGNNLPFDTFDTAAPSTAVPTATPTQAPSQPTVNWDNWGSDPATTAPGAGTTIEITTNRPANTIAVVTQQPTDTPAPTASTLRKGASGTEVRQVQQRLKTLGYLSGSVDGDFGSATKTAVIAFQRNNGLTADGKAGTATLNKLYAEEQKKESSTKEDDDSEVSSTGYVVLREGSEGEAVRKLQQALKKLGYYSGSVDGSFGSGTTSAVQAFQRANDLTVDGAAGPSTQRALYGTSSSITYATLREGDTGSAVKNLQYALYELGYYDGRLDSDYGSTTSDAVRAFQIQNNISPVDGVAGNKTLQKLYSSSAKAAAAATSEYETLREGSKGSDVVEMQECLVQMGYLADVTGVYDSATTAAVKAFQRNNGLSVDGTAGNETLKKLYSNNAKGN